MIYDCFLLNNELEVLEIRLNELDSVVDKFVITESTVTHMNKPKELFYYKNRGKFSKFKNKIIHNVIKDSPDVNNPWIINDFQFSQMARGLKEAKPQDVILFGDLDEIPKAEKIHEAISKVGIHKVFKQWLCYYFLNYASVKPFDWPGTHMMRYKDLVKIQSMWIAKYSPIDTFINEAGWHFSYIGGIKRIQQKISSQAHQEYNTNKYNTPENIMSAIRRGTDYMGAGVRFRVQGDDFLPAYVNRNKKKFSNLLLKKDFNSVSTVPITFFLAILHHARIKARKFK